MSADNFYFVEDGKVYMGFASDYDYHCEQERIRLEAEHRDEIDARFRESIVETKEPLHVAGSNEDAARWAGREMSEYGVWWVSGFPEQGDTDE